MKVLLSPFHYLPDKPGEIFPWSCATTECVSQLGKPWLSYPLAPWATGRAVELERNSNERRTERWIQMAVVWVWGPVHAASAGHCCAPAGCLAKSSVSLVVWHLRRSVLEWLIVASEYWMKRVNFTARLPRYMPHCWGHYDIIKCL